LRTATKRVYEGMFLVDSALAASDWDGVIGAIERILGRAGAEVLSVRKWDERKLEYEIQRKSRGTYILTYFNASSDKIGGIERDVQLSEQVLRVLILRGDHVTPEVMAQDTPLMLVEKQAAAAAAAAAEPAVETAEPAVEAAAEVDVDAGPVDEAADDVAGQDLDDVEADETDEPK